MLISRDTGQQQPLSVLRKTKQRPNKMRTSERYFLLSFIFVLSLDSYSSLPTRRSRATPGRHFGSDITTRRAFWSRNVPVPAHSFRVTLSWQPIGWLRHRQHALLARWRANLSCGSQNRNLRLSPTISPEITLGELHSERTYYTYDVLRTNLCEMYLMSKRQNSKSFTYSFTIVCQNGSFKLASRSI